MVDPTFTISIDRTSLSLDPLVLSGADDGSTLGVVGYSEPAYQARIQYAGESQWVHGSTAVSATWQQSLLGFDVTPTVTTETALKAAITELRAAISRVTFFATVTTSGASETWRCDWGSIGAVTRDYSDLANLDPIYPVTIPVYPIPGV